MNQNGMNGNSMGNYNAYPNVAPNNVGSQPPKKSNFLLVGIIGAILIAVIIGVIVFFLLNKDDKKDNSDTNSNTSNNTNVVSNSNSNIASNTNVVTNSNSNITSNTNTNTNSNVPVPSNSNSNSNVVADKVTTCTYHNAVNSETTVDGTYVVRSKDGIVLKVESKETITSSDASYLQTSKLTIAQMYSKYQALPQYNVKVWITGNTLNSTVDIDWANMNMNDIAAIDPTITTLLNSDGKLELDLLLYSYQLIGATCK